MVDVFDVLLIKRLLDFLAQLKPRVRFTRGQPATAAERAEERSFTRPSAFLYGALVYLFDWYEYLKIPAGRHTWTVEASGELERNFYCAVRGEDYMSKGEARLLAKLDISYATSDFAFPATSMQQLPHKVVIEVEPGVLSSQAASSETLLQVIQEIPPRPETAIANFLRALCNIYYTALTFMCHRAAPTSILVATLVYTAYDVLADRVYEALDMKRRNIVKRGILKFPCGCERRASRYVWLDVSKLAGIVCDLEEDYVKKTVHESDKRGRVMPNFIVAIDDYCGRAEHVNWLKSEHVSRVLPEVKADISRASRSILAVLFLDVLTPQTIAMVYTTIV